MKYNTLTGNTWGVLTRVRALSTARHQPGTPCGTARRLVGPNTGIPMRRSLALLKLLCSIGAVASVYALTGTLAVGAEYSLNEYLAGLQACDVGLVYPCGNPSDAELVVAKVLDSDDRWQIRFDRAKIWQDRVGFIDYKALERWMKLPASVRNGSQGDKEKTLASSLDDNLPTLESLRFFLSSIYMDIIPVWNEPCRNLSGKTIDSYKFEKNTYYIRIAANGTLCPVAEGIEAAFDVRFEDSDIPKVITDELVAKGQCYRDAGRSICPVRHYRIAVDPTRRIRDGR